MKTAKKDEKTKELLIMHCRAYPQLKVQDLFKFLFQSSFGCEHLASSLEAATEYICEEYTAVNQNNERDVEPLDGNYSRVHLSYLNKGLCASTLAKLFVASSKHEKNGQSDLLQKIEIARELVSDGLLPFSQSEFEEAVSEWAAKGYPAIRHSDAFKNMYSPSYRVISNEYIPLLPVLTEIDNKLAKNTY